LLSPNRLDHPKNELFGLPLMVVFDNINISINASIIDGSFLAAL
jgi:hypothetical protein